MIVKRNFSPKKVMGYVWRPLLYSTSVAGAVVVAQQVSGTTRLAAPIYPIGTLGAALAIFVIDTPFENQITDVALTSITTDIERDLREQLGPYRRCRIPSSVRGRGT